MGICKRHIKGTVVDYTQLLGGKCIRSSLDFSDAAEATHLFAHHEPAQRPIWRLLGRHDLLPKHASAFRP